MRTHDSYLCLTRFCEPFFMQIESIFTIQNDSDFEQLAIRVFNHQYIHNIVYQRFCNLLGKNKSSVKQLSDIPYLPIQFFKQDKIVATTSPIQKVFTSSGTTQNITSSHYVSDLAVYEKSFRHGFHHFYGDISQYTLLALLPSYLERDGSSLVYMVEKLIEDTNQPDSGFYLYDTIHLTNTIQKLKNNNQKFILLGVSFALLDLLDSHEIPLPKDTIVMETGGMKGRRKEMIREELHAIYTNGFKVSTIHSEYGMTELLSQAYSKGDGVFFTPPWMKVSIRDTDDALAPLDNNKSGGINIIDLANINSCAFIATQDLGKVHSNGGFEVLGRFDHSDIRGCNLMAL